MKVKVISDDDSGAGLTSWLNMRGFHARLASKLCPSAIPEWTDQDGEPDFVWPPWADDPQRAAKVKIFNGDPRLRDAIANRAKREADPDVDPRRMLLWLFDGNDFVTPAYECLAFDQLLAGNLGPHIGTSIVALRRVQDEAPPARGLWIDLLGPKRLGFRGPMLISGDATGFSLGIPPDVEAALFGLVKDTKALLGCVRLQSSSDAIRTTLEDRRRRGIDDRIRKEVCEACPNRRYVDETGFCGRLDGADEYAVAIHVSTAPWPVAYRDRAFALPRREWNHFFPRNIHVESKRGSLYTQSGDLGCVVARAPAICPAVEWPRCGGMGLACHRLFHVPHQTRGMRHGGTLYEMQQLVSDLQYRSDFANLIRHHWPDSFAQPPAPERRKRDGTGHIEPRVRVDAGT